MDFDQKAKLTALVEAGHAQRVLSALSATQFVDSSDPDVWFLRGRASFRLKAFHDALFCFREAGRRDPDHAHTAYYLGLTSERLGDVNEARTNYERALALDPHMKEAQRKVASLSSPARGPHLEGGVASPSVSGAPGPSPKPSGSRESGVRPPIADPALEDDPSRAEPPASREAAKGPAINQLGLPTPEQLPDFKRDLKAVKRAEWEATFYGIAPWYKALFALAVVGVLVAMIWGGVTAYRTMNEAQLENCEFMKKNFPADVPRDCR